MGISPEVFWGLTPWQFVVYQEGYRTRIEQEHDMRAWIMWHGAAITRSTQRIPPLSNFMSGKKQSKGIDESAILARLKAYNKRLQEESNGSQA